MNEDIEDDGEVSEEGFIRRVAVILLGHGYKYRDLIWKITRNKENMWLACDGSAAGVLSA